LDTAQILETAVRIAREKKGEAIRVLDVSSNLGITDFFVLITADSRRQALAIATEIDIALKHAGVPKGHIEGRTDGWWVLLDFDSVVVHVFQRGAREFYRLDELWADALDRTGDFLSGPSRDEGV